MHVGYKRSRSSCTLALPLWSRKRENNQTNPSWRATLQSFHGQVCLLHIDGSRASIPVLVSAVYRYQIMDWHWIKMGIMGLVEYELLSTLKTLKTDNVKYIDCVDAGKRLFQNRGCKVLVALFRCG